MPLRRPGRGLVTALALGAALLTLPACSGGSAKPSPDDLQVQVASYDLAVGPPSRFIVGVLSFDNRLLAFGSVQLRFAYLGSKDAPVTASYGPAVSTRYLPVPGTTVPSPVPQEARLVSPSEARGVYAAVAGFARPGFWQVEVAATVGGRSQTATSAFEVRSTHLVPAPGDQAPATDNLTISAPPDVPRAAIDSRAATTGGQVPDAELHRTTVAAALAARRPAVVVFSTPVYCQSQFCGPVTDMVADLARQYANRASFIHIEIFREFSSNTVNKAAADWLLEGGLNEPWVFLIGADGRIAARFDNVVTREELEPLLQALPVIGPAPG